MKSKDKAEIVNILFKVAACIWLLIIMGGLIYFLYRYFDLEIDDDSGAEMVLSHLISKGGPVIRHDWYYSSEIRILNTQLVYSTVFRFLQNWHAVRIIGNVIMYFILLAVMWYLSKQLHIKYSFPLFAAVLILPVSYDYYLNALHSAYLLPHITLSGLMLAMFLHYSQSDKKKVRYFLIAGLNVISFFVGLGGIRHLIIFFMPLLLACAFIVYQAGSELIQKKDLKDKRIVRTAVALELFMAAFAGFVVNRLYLKKAYDFSTYYISDESFFTDLDSEQFLTVLNGWFRAYGYQSGNSIFSFHLLQNMLPAVLLLLLFFALRCLLGKKNEDDQQKIMALFFLIGFISLTMLFSFSTMMYADRYLTPISVFAYPLICCFMEKWITKPLFKGLVGISAALFISFCGFMNYMEFKTLDNSAESREVADILLSEGYYNGYTFMFWKYGTNLTEYSDGKLSVWKEIGENNPAENTVDNINDIHRWLELKSHRTEKPTGKVFLISDGDINALNEGKILYRGEGIVVYGYDDPELLEQDFEN